MKSRRMKLAGHVARMGDRKGAYMVLGEETRGKDPLGKLIHKWEDNIKMNFQDVRWGGMDWINLAQDRNRWRALVNVVMNFGAIKCGELD
jgi:hypothetical protein